MKKILFMFLIAFLHVAHADNVNDYFSKIDIEKFSQEQDNLQAKFKDLKPPQNVQTIADNHFGKHYFQLTYPRLYFSKKENTVGFITCFKNENNDKEAIFTVNGNVISSTFKSPEMKPFSIIICSFFDYYDKKIGMSEIQNVTINEAEKTKDNNTVQKRLTPSKESSITDFSNAVLVDKKLFIDFINQNQDKYISEINKIGDYDIKTIFKSNYQLDKLFFDSTITFDSETGKGSISYLGFGPKIELSETCKINGSYIGSNSFGVKTRVTKKYCKYYTLSNLILNTKDGIYKKSFNLTPEDYRYLKKMGANFDVYFLIKGDLNKVVATHNKGYSEATIDSPIEFEYDNYVSNIDVLRIEIKIPNKENQIIYQ